MNPQDATSQALDATIATIGWNTTKVGTVTTVGAFLLSSQGAALVGICLGVVGLLVQWFYRRKQDRREQAEHDRRMALYE
jgi:hypothetical protein